MLTFILSLIALLLGFVFYSRVAERVFGPDDRETPAIRKADGVDYIVLPTWRIFMIQFLNIAGTGPIFGAIMGMWYGPVAYIWIIVGCIFGGALHDYMNGMISLRHGGSGLPDLTGRYLGKTALAVLMVVTIGLLLVAGVVFIYSPAIILSSIWGDMMMWVVIIFVYYIIATMLPISKVIGRVYPLFGASMLFMVFGLMLVLFLKHPSLPEAWDGLSNWGAARFGMKSDIFPALFVTLACGAVSGFHATQSPMMARCLPNERLGRPIFYGAMITEGLVALVWCTISNYFFFYEGWREVCPPELIAQFEGQQERTLIQFFDAPMVVKIVCTSWLGVTGSILAILGVVAAPISTGDTCFRSARLIVAETLHYGQRSVLRRLSVSFPLFAVALAMLVWQIKNPDGFRTIWQYMGWGTQFLAAVSLWVSTVYLATQRKCYWITLLPAVFMTLVSMSFLMVSKTAFGLSEPIGFTLAALIVVACVTRFFFWRKGIKFDTK
jgi:carbon starvation protein CstA